MAEKTSEETRAERSGRVWRGITIPRGSSQTFEIRLYDEMLATFEARIDRFGVRSYHMGPVEDCCRKKLPLGLLFEGDDDSLLEWLRTRTVPRHQKYAREILRSAGIDPDDVIGQVSMSLGLSLTDALWVTPAGLDMTWDEVNLYENDDRDVLSLIAYTGELVDTSQQSLLSTSWGTSGSFAKAWRVRGGGRLVLYKTGSDFGAANSGQEPWSEFVASQAADACVLPHVAYGLDWWKGRKACTCELMNDARTALAPSYLAVGTGSFYAILARYAAIGPQTLESFRDMVVFDALIANTDRHGANYAFLRDNTTGTLTGLAPLYDHNLSLFASDLPMDYPQWRDASRVYTDDFCRPAGHEMTFDQQAELTMGTRQRRLLERVLDLELTNVEGKAAVPDERLRAWQEYLRTRAGRLLEIPQLPEEELWEVIEGQHVSREDLPLVRTGLVHGDLQRLWPNEIRAE